MPRNVTTIQPVKSIKYLGVIFYRNLNWKVHQAYTVKKGAKWAVQIQRLTHPTWKITPKFAKQLFTIVALPRVLYAVDLWCTLVNNEYDGPKMVGSARAIKQFMSIQRAGALAIIGGLHMSPTDALNTSTFLLLASLTIKKWCFRAMVRMVMLPRDHPLHKPVNWKRTHLTKRHHGPLQVLANTLSTDTKNGENSINRTEPFQDR